MPTAETSARRYTWNSPAGANPPPASPNGTNSPPPHAPICARWKNSRAARWPSSAPDRIAMRILCCGIRSPDRRERSLPCRWCRRDSAARLGWRRSRRGCGRLCADAEAGDDRDAGLTQALPRQLASLSEAKRKEARFSSASRCMTDFPVSIAVELATARRIALLLGTLVGDFWVVLDMRHAPDSP